MINIFNRNSILIYYVFQVIFNCYTFPYADKIVTKEILLSEKRPFNFAFSLLFTHGINVLFFIFLGIFTEFFSTLFTSSYYISDDGQLRSMVCSDRYLKLWKFIHHQQSQYQPGKTLYRLFTYLYSTQMSLYFSINPSVYLLIFAM